MGEWEETTLGEVIDIKHGYAFKGKYITQEKTDKILVTPGNFHIGGGFKQDKFKYFSSSDFPKEYILTPDDIIVTMTDLSKDGDTLGYTAKIPYMEGVIFLHNQRVGLVKFKNNNNNNNTDREFIYWLMRTREYQQYIVSASSGTSIKHTSPTAIKNYAFFLPPLPEQKAIAEILSSLDDKIDLLHRQNKTLEAIAETLFRQWFVEEANPSWPNITIGDIAKTNISTLRTDHPYEIIKYLDTGSITEGKIEKFEIYSLKDSPSRAKRLVQHNDIIVSTVRPNHKHYGFIKNPPNNLVVSTGFCVLTCSAINPHFIYYLLTQNEMTEYLSTIAEASTSTYPSLKPSDIETVEFQLPSKEILHTFCNFTENAWEKIDSNHQQIRNLEKLRDTLLPKLMSGEVRVKYEEEAL